VIAPSKHVSSEAVRFHRSSLPPDERGVAEGLPLTSPARTILDLSPFSSDRAAERMIEVAERRLIGCGAPLPTLLQRYPRRPGAPRIRRLLDARGGLTATRSELEERFLALLRRWGFREPLLNAPIRLAAHAYELDCYWPDLRLAVELDGYAFHAGRSSFRDDRIRDRRLRGAGIETVRVSAHDLGAGVAELEADLLAIRPGLRA
jgi:very-short-patch-repair endonuclease